jgi:hypothetical protein
MADKEKSALTAAAALDGTEIVDIIQTGNSRKTTAAAIAHSGFVGCRIKKSVDQTAANYTTVTEMTFDEDVFDVGSWHDTGSNTHQVIIPADVAAVEIVFAVKLGLVTADNWASIHILKGGTSVCNLVFEAGGTTPGGVIHSGVLPVTPGDILTFTLLMESDTSITVTAAQTFVSVRKVY